MRNVARIIVGPINTEGLDLRVVELSDGSGRVEVWNGILWVPAGGNRPVTPTIPVHLQTPVSLEIH